MGGRWKFQRVKEKEVPTRQAIGWGDGNLSCKNALIREKAKKKFNPNVPDGNA